MALFEFEAMDADGRVRRGRMEASGEGELVAALQARAQRPLSVRAVPAGSVARGGRGAARWSVQARPFPGDGRIQFVNQLAALLGASQPLDRALQILQDMPGDAATRAVLQGVRERVLAGQSLSAAMAAQDSVFPRLDVGLVRAGEAGGSLPATLTQLADYLERQRALRARVVGALVYPAVLLAVVVAALLFLLAYVLPQFAAMYSSLEVELPWFSSSVLAVGLAARAHGPWVLGVLAIALAAAWLRLRQDDARLALDRAVLGWRWVGGLLARLETARLARTLGTLVGNGVPVLDALSLSREVLVNRALAQDLEQAVVQVRSGRSLASALADGRRIPPLALNMVQVGEESGALDVMLLKVADTFERDSELAISRLLTAMVPVITLLLAAAVGLVILAVLVPLYDLTGAIG
jgi:general secretion pathway protein F